MSWWTPEERRLLWWGAGLVWAGAIGAFVVLPLLSTAVREISEANLPKFSLLVQDQQAGMPAYLAKYQSREHERPVVETDLTQRECDAFAASFPAAICSPMQSGDVEIARTIERNGAEQRRMFTDAERRRKMERNNPGLAYARDPEARATTALQNYMFHRQNVRDCVAGSQDCELPNVPEPGPSR